MNYYKFGSLVVKICGADGYFKKVAKDYEIPVTDNYDIGFNLIKKDSITEPDCKKNGDMPCALADLSWYSDGENMYMTGFNAPTNEHIFCAKPDKDFKNIEVDMLDIRIDADDSQYIKNVLDLVMRFAVVKHDRINIHSSSLAYLNNGILFSAPSGTGKSTHTALWQEGYPETVIINDDLPLITVGDNILISGTPWCGTSGINTNVTVPLKAIVFLRRGEQNSIEKINAAQSMKYLIDEVFKTPVPEMLDKQFDLISKILTKVPAYLLKCNISQDAVETVKKELGI